MWLFHSQSFLPKSDIFGVWLWQLLLLLADIRQGWEGLQLNNTQAYNEMDFITTVKSFMELAHEEKREL